MFIEHGSFRVELKGNILVLDIKGAWNFETSLAYQKAITEVIQPVIGFRWAVLTLMDDWELCTPDCESTLVGIVQEAVKNGLVREAVVNSVGVVKLELFKKYHDLKLLSDKNEYFKRQIYTEKNSALEWLAEQGFSFEHSVEQLSH